MATMEMDYNLKSRAKLFKLFPHVYKKTKSIFEGDFGGL